jgi:glyoxylase-like metal-dependent hydrolase (beta-lactamase superfamily II)
VVSLGKYNFHILHTPGHTADSICVSVNVEGKKVLFSGDTILAEALIGEFGATVDFNSYMQSIEKIAGLNVDVLLPGHKVFVLSRANVHVDTCLENFKRKWSGYVIGPTPFYPSWWMNTFPELLQDCDER